MYTFKICGDDTVYLLTYSGGTKAADTGLTGSVYRAADELGARVAGVDEAAWGRAVLMSQRTTQRPVGSSNG